MRRLLKDAHRDFGTLVLAAWFFALGAWAICLTVLALLATVYR